jgi:2,4-dienoyl-CoA reductase-like NADH-dependent reductase (Old Yellow Enzyme family)
MESALLRATSSSIFAINRIKARRFSINLFEPVKFGSIKAKNRIIMAPLTRCRAIQNRVPNQLMLQYYVQRASAGLILTEATAVTPMGVGYPNTPGIWSEEQVEAWKTITAAVHNAGGKIVLQLWHVGRISHPIYLNGELPVAPSAIAPKGHVQLVYPRINYAVPRALKLEEISSVIESYRQGAINAKEAGFDGVEVHGANGYLLDQFLADSTNHRTDSYGGSLENRARLMLEVTDAAISVWGADRVGLHLSPRCEANDVSNSNPLETFTYVTKEANKRNLAFICVREYQAENSIGLQLRNLFNGSYIANEKFTKESAEKLIQDGGADAVAFGHLFIANPDLPHRFEVGAPLNTPNTKTFYTADEKGYNDYPFL